MEATSNQVSEHLYATKKSSYYSFLRSFDYSLNKHLRKTDEYKRNLKGLANEGQRVELALLVEVHTDFSGMFLRDSKGVTRCPLGFMPMFDDVVSLLEGVSGRIDHIVLVMGGTAHGDEASVLALNGHNIQRSLEKQRVTIYEYVGEDRFLPEMRGTSREVNVASSHTHSKGNLDITAECTWTDVAPECKFEAALLGLRRVYEASLVSRCCVFTFPVHFLSEIFMDKIVYWLEGQNGKITAFPYVRISAEEWDAKFRSFEDNWMGESKG